MNNKAILVLAASAAMGLAACDTQTEATTQAGQIATDLFEANGYTVENITTSDGLTTFSIVDENGGSNVKAASYDDAMEAANVYDDVKATLTQSEYYMMSEKENDEVSAALFNNSINYVDGLVVYDKQSGMVISATEISQASIDQYLELLTQYGIEL